MSIVGKVELTADKDVRAGTETSMSGLFPIEGRKKEFVLEANVARDKTKLKVTVAKLGILETTADTTRQKGDKLNLWLLIKTSDFSKRVKASETIKKGDILPITVDAV